MSFDPILITKINGVCFKITFHDPETFFNLPTPLIDFYNVERIIFQIGADSIETIIDRLLFDRVIIDVVDCLVSSFTFCGDMVFFDPPAFIINLFFIFFMI